MDISARYTSLSWSFVICPFGFVYFVDYSFFILEFEKIFKGKTSIVKMPFFHSRIFFILLHCIQPLRPQAYKKICVHKKSTFVLRTATICCTMIWGVLFNPFLFIRGLSCSSCFQASLSLNCLKGIDRSFKLRGESRLIWSVLANWRLGNFFYFILNGHHHKISKKPLDAA